MSIRKLLLLILMLLTLSVVSKAQEIGTLRGLVTDSTTTEVLPFGNVFIKELAIGASTDSRGYFLITSIPAGRNYTLVVSYVGYRTKTLTVKITANKVTHYDIKLSPADIQLQTIEKVGERINNANETNISIQKISAKSLEALPKGIETDIFRSIKYLSGVQSTGDVSAKYYVRGGASNQNLVQIDGITIYNPFHALGLFSVVDPDIINSIEFYKGGFGSQFGGRLSSVMEINTKDGNKNRYSSKASLSFLTGKFLLEGPIPSGSFILTGRKSYSNQIIKKFLNEKSVPIDFYDISFKANFSDPNFIKDGKFSFNGFFSKDNIKSGDPKVEDYTWSNNSFGFKWFQVTDVPLFYEIGLTVSNFKGNNDPKFSNVYGMNNQINDIGASMNFSYIFDSRDEVNLGFNINQIETKLSLQNAVGIPLTLNASNAKIVFFGRYNFLQIEDLKLDIGTRVNLTTLTNSKKSLRLEPRINALVKVLPGLALKAAFGVYQQELTTLSNENEVINIFEPWLITPNYLNPAKAYHYIAGFDFTGIPNLDMNVETYIKRAYDVAMLNQNKTFPSQPDFVATDTESSGLEVSTRYILNPAVFSINYAFTHTYRKLNGLLYYPKYDIRHSLNVSLEIDFGSGWSMNSVWVYNSGLPFTEIVGYYNKYYFSDFFASWDKYDPLQPYAILGIQNLARLPDYHRLDVSITKKFQTDFMNVEIGLSAINVYDRKNIFYFKRDTGERVNMLPFLPSATVKIEL